MNVTQALAIRPAAVGLMLLMAATRFHHFGTAVSLPDASLAVFFLAGFWQSGRYLLVALLIEAGLIDYLAINQLGVSDYCISLAYAFLLPAYALLWQTGKYCGKQAMSTLTAVAKTLVWLVMAVSAAFFISDTSFYLLSDKISDMSWSQYAQGFVLYYPSYLGAAVMYSALPIGLLKLAKLLITPIRQTV